MGDDVDWVNDVTDGIVFIANFNPTVDEVDKENLPRSRPVRKRDFVFVVDVIDAGHFVLLFSGC
jgi:hypothetical protein